MVAGDVDADAWPPWGINSIVLMGVWCGFVMQVVCCPLRQSHDKIVATWLVVHCFTWQSYGHGCHIIRGTNSFLSCMVAMVVGMLAGCVAERFVVAATVRLPSRGEL